MPQANWPPIPSFLKHVKWKSTQNPGSLVRDYFFKSIHPEGGNGPNSKPIYSIIVKNGQPHSDRGRGSTHPLGFSTVHQIDEPNCWQAKQLFILNLHMYIGVVTSNLPINRCIQRKEYQLWLLMYPLSNYPWKKCQKKQFLDLGFSLLNIILKWTSLGLDLTKHWITWTLRNGIVPFLLFLDNLLNKQFIVKVICRLIIKIIISCSLNIIKSNQIDFAALI